MHLPRQLLLRIRRNIQRQLAMPKPFTTDLEDADCQAWRQRRQPTRSMKTVFYLVLAFVLTWFLLGLTGCQAIGDIPLTIGIEGRHGTYGYNTERGLEIRARVREEKSGRITPTEIANRWRP